MAGLQDGEVAGRTRSEKLSRRLLGLARRASMGTGRQGVGVRNQEGLVLKGTPREGRKGTKDA